MKGGYCDARCWFARGKHCTCWCGGINHGIGNKEVEPDSDEALLKELLNDPIIYKYGLTKEQFEFYKKKRDKEALAQIRMEVGLDYKLTEQEVNERVQDNET